MYGGIHRVLISQLGTMGVSNGSQSMNQSCLHYTATKVEQVIDLVLSASTSHHTQADSGCDAPSQGTPPVSEGVLVQQAGRSMRADEVAVVIRAGQRGGVPLRRSRQRLGPRERYLRWRTIRSI